MSDHPARPSRLNSLRHPALLVPNLEECECFYVDVLGMEVLNRANEDLVYPTCGNDSLSLGRACTASNGPQIMDHYGFVADSVEELEAWYRYLRALGVTLLDQPFDHGDGTRSFHLLDPAGNKAQPLYHLAVSGQRPVRASGSPLPLFLKGEGRLGTLSASNLTGSSSPLLGPHQVHSVPAPPSIRQRKRFHHQAQIPPQRGTSFFIGSQQQMEPMHALRFSAGLWRCVLAWMFPLVGLVAQGVKLSELERLRIAQVSPAVERIGDPEGDYGVRRLSKGEETLSYAFRTLNVIDILAYSGKPINLQVIPDPQAAIHDVYILEHHEPILLIGIPEEKLHVFSTRYDGVCANQRVVASRSSDPQAVTVDAVSGAMVTVMVVNKIVTRAAHTVVVSLGLIKDRGNVRPKPAQVRQQPAATVNWSELFGNGTIRHLQLSRGQIDDTFRGSGAKGIGEVDAAHRDEPSIDLYSALLNPSAVDRSLPGDNQYRELMASLKPGEHVFVVPGDDEYSFKGSGYVRGGTFDRAQLCQLGDIIGFRDLDYQRLSNVYVEDMLEFREMAIFVARASQRFDPGSLWTLELLVRRQTGPVVGVFTSFELAYQTPEEHPERPQPTAEELTALEEAARPLWLRVWYQKSSQIGVLCTALVLFLAIPLLQDRLVRRPRLMQQLHISYLAFTLAYLSWYSFGQLSVVNALTFVHALFEGFCWELFLSGSLSFILWAFTVASLLLWGHGVFCGWLCLFGAPQGLLNELARKLRVPQLQVSFAAHEWLWAIKYIILLVLFGLSLESLVLTE